MSQNNIIEELDNNFDFTNNNDNDNNNYSNKILRVFKTNNRIYMKPKHSIVRSFERQQTSNADSVKQEQNLNDIKVNEVYNSNNDSEVKITIKVKRVPKNKEIININNTNANNDDNLKKKFNKKN